MVEKMNEVLQILNKISFWDNPFTRGDSGLITRIRTCQILSDYFDFNVVVQTWGCQNQSNHLKNKNNLVMFMFYIFITYHQCFGFQLEKCITKEWLNFSSSFVFRLLFSSHFQQWLLAEQFYYVQIFQRQYISFFELLTYLSWKELGQRRSIRSYLK